MRIVNDIQLDFDDVLIQPKRSTLNSRKEVEIYREFKWKNNDGKELSFKAIPIMASNMGTTGTIEMAKVLSTNGYMCALEKHYSSSDISKLFGELETRAISENKDAHEYTQRIFPSIGVNDSLDTISDVLHEHYVTGIVIDIANGYILKLIDKVREVREKFPDMFIVVGNVVTEDVTTDLILAGANCVKAGIGGGCFLGNMKVLTNKGLKKIQDISFGDMVLTHTGKYERVVNKFEFSSHKKIIDINGIKCTPEHKFYVANTDDMPKITDENYQEYCFWVEAKDLDVNKHRLIKMGI